MNKNSIKDSGVVYLWNLPSDKVYVELRKDFHKKISSMIKNKAEFCRVSNLSYSIVKKFIYGIRAISLRDLRKIILTLDKNLLKETEQNIFKIGVKSGGKGLVNPKLPFNLNSVDGAIIISSILHDGGIATTLNPYYFNSDKKIRRKVYNAMSNVFGDIYSAANPKKERLLFPKIIGIVLVNCIGLKSGNKVVTNLEIPHFIMDADEIIRGAFLKQAFDDEGCISRNEIYLSLSANVTCISKMFRKKILKNKLLKYSSEIFKGDKKLLESFGISINNIVVDQTSFIKDNKLHLRHRWKLCITTKKNLEIFFSKINFDIDYKKIRLRKLIEKYTRYEKTKFLPTEALIKTLKIFCEIEEKYGYLSSPIIKENFNRSDATICLRLNQFKDMGMLKIVNQNSLNTKAYIYKTTTNARKIIIDASKKKIVENYIEVFE